MKRLTLSARLSSALPYIRENAFVVDVGTDHAYLPIFLVGEGRVRGAVATDIHEGPVRRACDNVSTYGLADRIRVMRTDGLAGLTPEERCDVIVFGMGGELIVRILGDSPCFLTPGVRLILQPMTHAREVRQALAAWGFSILGESLSEDGGRIYETLCAEYGDIQEPYSETELLLGRENIARGGARFAAFVAHKKSIYEAIRAQKRAAGLKTEEEDALLTALSSLPIKEEEI